MNTKLVYTVIFNNYDQLLPVNQKWNCDFVCLTDNPHIKSNGWKIQVLDEEFASYKSANRKFKILAHNYFPNYESSLYVDGNIRIKKDPTELFEKYLKKENFASCIHYARDCIYEETITLLFSGRLNDYEKLRLLNQIALYSKESFPRHFGLTETNVLFRNHMEPSVVRIMEMWWSELSDGSHRDQVSLPYVLWKSNSNITYIDEGPRFNDVFFALDLHASERKSFSKRVCNSAVRIAVMHKKNNLFAFLFLKLVDVYVVIKHRLYCVVKYK
jgi:hypothetical protein